MPCWTLIGDDDPILIDDEFSVTNANMCVFIRCISLLCVSSVFIRTTVAQLVAAEPCNPRGCARVYHPVLLDAAAALQRHDTSLNLIDNSSSSEV